MIFKENTNVKEFIGLSYFYDMTATLEETATREMPKKLGGYDVPQTLDSITFGIRLDLQDINTDQDFLVKPLQLLAKFSEDDILKLNAWDVIRFSHFVVSELNRFAKRDADNLKYKFDEEEIKAGIKQINHGVFGLIDVIAKRMNISHDEVLDLGQAKVFMMLKIDIDNANYQKNLRDVFNSKS